MSDSVARPPTLEESDTFQDHGYRGLYGGLNATDLRGRKGLSETEPLVSRMDSTELAANLFQVTQTDDRLRRDDVGDRRAANKMHEDVGRHVRQSIEDIGGTMPEDLPSLELGAKAAVEKGGWHSMDDMDE